MDSDGTAAAQERFLAARGLKHGFTSNFTSAAGVRFHYLTVGNPEDPCLVFIHGGSGNCCSWWRNFDFFADRSFYCVAVDLRFYGASSSSDDLCNGFTGGETFAKDVIAALDAEHVDKAVLLCQSLTGCAALFAAANFPDRVAGVVMCNTNRGIPRDEEDEALAGALALAPWPSQWPVRGLSPRFQEAEGQLTQLFLDVRALNQKGLGHDLESACKRRTVPADRLGLLAHPMLMLSSGHDPFFSRAMLEKSAQSLALCELVHVPDCGHSVYFEDPAVFNQTVEDWIARCVPGHFKSSSFAM
ncbi:unnamed protein product [Polarella glacialis]|uniref:AB hydrolase-1 domain-containing protein n=1 Tax=Polarella glacialis TaxID=89957 RepID=A0A813JAA6_POLGL|nr:unnamed protein product [Polarella glacialis]CAE8677365.1 unnamed protein product [Polarella glacialis]